MFAERFELRIEAGGFPKRIIHGVSIPPDELTVVLDVSRTLEVELIQIYGSLFTGRAEASAGQDERFSMQ